MISRGETTKSTVTSRIILHLYILSPLFLNDDQPIAFFSKSDITRRQTKALDALKPLNSLSSAVKKT